MRKGREIVGGPAVYPTKISYYEAIYMLHCHILEHQDDGMMTQFEVVVPSATAAQTLNLSGRLQVGTGDNILIGGFIIADTGRKKVLLRGIGLSLSSQG